MTPSDMDRVDALVRELIDIDKRRVAVVQECGSDIARGVALTRPLVEDHKRVLTELRELMGE